MYCVNCGKQYEGGFCPECGTPASSVNDTSVTNSKSDRDLTSSNVQEDVKTYVIGAGQRAINGERQLATKFDIVGEAVTATSYNRTTKSSPISSCAFRKRDVGSIIYKKTSHYTKLDKIRMVMFLVVVPLFGIAIPPLILIGPAVAIIYAMSNRYKTMVISLSNATCIKAYYAEQREADEIYNVLMK